MLRIGSKNSITGILVDCCILKKTFCFVCKTTARYDFNVNLDTLTGMSHLFIRL